MRQNLAHVELYADAPLEKYEEVSELPSGWPLDANVETIIADDAFAHTEQNAKGVGRLSQEDFTEKAIIKKRAELLRMLNGEKNESVPTNVIYPDAWKLEPQLRAGEDSGVIKNGSDRSTRLELVPESSTEVSNASFEFKDDKFPSNESLLPEYTLTAGYREEFSLKSAQERSASGGQLKEYFDGLRNKQRPEAGEALPDLVKPRAVRDADRTEIRAFFKGRNSLPDGEKPEEITLNFDQNKQKPKEASRGLARFIPAFARRFFGR